MARRSTPVIPITRRASGFLTKPTGGLWCGLHALLAGCKQGASRVQAGVPVHKYHLRKYYILILFSPAIVSCHLSVLRTSLP